MNDKKARNYILDSKGNPIPCSDFSKWAEWFEKSEDRVVAATEFSWGTVSTVFLGVNHAWDDGPPILWETMIFGGPLDELQTRCSGNREQAQAMHEEMLNKFKNS